MSLDELNEQLDNLEIDDLKSAIKGHILGFLTTTLEDCDDDSAKIKLNGYSNIDQIVYELEEEVSDTIYNYLDDCYELDSKDSKMEDQCL